MAESTLSVTRDDLRRRAALVLGFGTDMAKWAPTSRDQIDMCVLDGVREAYWPVKDGKPYEWSFMRVSMTFATASGTGSYTMADTFWQVPDRLVVSTGSGSTLVEILDPDHLIQLRTLEAAANATPLYAAFRPTSIPLSTSVSTRWECLLYPTPNAILTMQMHVAVNPESIMSANNYPVGSAMFAQTLIAAVMATAEKYYVNNDSPQQGPAKYQQAFAERLQATMMADNAMKTSSMTWATTEPTYGTFSWLKRVCSIYLYNQPNLSLLNHQQSKECEADVRSGLVRFYAPPAMAEDEQPWSWSFLNVNTTLAVSSGTATYDLPLDFATMSGEFNYVTSAASGKLRMTRVSYEELSAMKAQSNASGLPQYFCISEKTSTGGATQSRYEVTFYPNPNATENYTYRYVRSPAALSTSATWPAGIDLYCEAISAACRSVCEERKEGNQGIEWQKFTALLSGAVKQDRQLMATGDTWDVAAEPGYGDFLWLKRAVSLYLYGKGNLNILDNAQSREAEAIVREGLARFYMPPPVSEGEQPWSWTFLKANATLAITNGTATYDLPTDLATMSGDFNFVTTATDKLRIARVSYETLSAMKASLAATGNPKYFCISQKASTGGSTKSRYEVTFYPTPTSNENLTYRYVRSPAVLSTSSVNAAGSEQHTPTIVAACRSVAEERKQGTQGQEWQKFMGLLAASVKTDRQLQDDKEESWETSAEPEYGSFLWLKREVAICLYKQPNLSALNNAQNRECDADVRSGLARFYAPPALSPDEQPWSWTFLNASATINITTPTTTYDLPTDLVTMSGDFTYSAAGTDRLRIQRVSYEDLMAMQSSNPTSGNPKYFAISQKASTGGATKSRYEVIFFPTPSANVTVSYRYVRSPSALSTSSIYPLGSEQHTPAIVAACRSVCEERTGSAGPEWQKFMAILSASIKADRQLVQNYSETWNTSQVQYGSLRWLSRRIGDFLGYGPNRATWNHAQSESVLDIVNRGIRQLQSAKDWSFLKYEGTLTLLVGTYIYSLPVDMVPGSIRGFSFVGVQKSAVEVCSPDSILNRRAMESDPSGAPKYAGIRSVATDIGELVHRQEVLFFPKPDTGYTLKFHYKLLPPLLSDDNPHPAGGESLAEAYLASCKLVAANTIGKDIEAATIAYSQALDAAASADASASQSKESFANTALAMGTYEWFQQEIGLALGYGANPAEWTYTQQMTVNSNIDRAHADFCTGFGFDTKTDAAHRWTFLFPETTIMTSAPYSTGTVSITAGVVTLSGGTFPTWAGTAWLSVAGVQHSVASRTSGTQIVLNDTTVTAAGGTSYTIYRRNYDFPSNFHAIDGGMVSLNSGSFLPLKNVDVRYIDENLPYAWETGVPQMFATVESAPGTTGVTHQFTLKPIPDGEYELRFRYSIGIPTFSAGMTCAGGALHAQAILYCALANIDPKKIPIAKQRMASAIALDRSRQPEQIGFSEGCWNADRYYRGADRVTTYMGQEWD